MAHQIWRHQYYRQRSIIAFGGIAPETATGHDCLAHLLLSSVNQYVKASGKQVQITNQMLFPDLVVLDEMDYLPFGRVDGAL